MTTSAPSTVKHPPRAAFSIAHPLDDFYAQMGLTLPPLQEVDGEPLPQPYSRLLVHDHDMTPTLENFHERDLHLRLFGQRRKRDQYFREVVLLLDRSDEPVEILSIQNYLNQFTHEA